MRSDSLGIWVENGSRHETRHQNGISHFIEHLLFKGTNRRSALRIAEEIDGVGGVLNAYTGKEYTCYYSKVLDENFNLAIDMLTDIFLHSVFDKEEIERKYSIKVAILNGDWNSRHINVLDTPGYADFISEAVRVRQMFGGGWRPAGIPAAAGIVALEGMISRLADDHARARALAEGLAALNGIEVDPNLVDSNIVLARPTEAAPETVAEGLIGEGVLVLPFGPYLRLVTHHEFTDADADATLTAFGAVLEGVGR